MNANNAVISLANLRKTYAMGSNVVHALQDVDLTIKAGEMVAIMGASGSGKSTLMNIVGCLDRPTSGTYELNGERVESLSRNQLADLRNRHIGFVFQGFNLLARTSAQENVELPLLYDRSERQIDPAAAARRALQRVMLDDRREHQTSELSGGQQQRVAIARALVTEPSLLLADEPTGNLDTRTSIEVLALFQELNEQGLTVAMVTHENEISQYARRVVELRDGLIIRDEPVSNRRSARNDLSSMQAV